jgi:hypothetical protein
MARLVIRPPENTPPEWGKRLAYLACILIPVLLLVVLLINERQPQRIRWEAITLSTSPPMPAADFLREVRAIGRFNDPLDLNEPELLTKLHQAFLQHDWVASVERIGLAGPTKLHVDLTFRKPVARIDRGTQQHLVDRQGKLLIPLFPQQVMGLVQLVGFDDRSAETTNWLIRAAGLVAELQSDLTTWKIVSIHLVRDNALDVADLRFKTQTGTYIVWQTMKGAVSDELTVAEKLTRLRLYQERFGNLEAPAGHVLDVRIKDGLQRRPISQ